LTADAISTRRARRGDAQERPLAQKAAGITQARILLSTP
jgi:hypothetical protein